MIVYTIIDFCFFNAKLQLSEAGMFISFTD